MKQHDDKLKKLCKNVIKHFGDFIKEIEGDESIEITNKCHQSEGKDSFNVVIPLDLKPLKDLITVPSPSGFETHCQKIFRKYLEDIGGTSYYADHIGNISYSFGNGSTKILLSAHIDELGLQVLDIEKSGLLVVNNLGGIDRKAITAGEVLVEKYGSNEWVRGVLGKKPIHAETHSERNGEVQDIHELRVDLGLNSREEVEELGVRIGSTIVYNRNLDPTLLNINLGKNICAPGLDDKIGVFILMEVAKRLNKDRLKELDLEIIIASCVQEELGLRGATVLAQNIKPEVSIDIDVTPSIDFGVKSEEFGNVEFGKGPVICLGPGCSRRITNLMDSLDIKNQRVVNLPGGTNTDVLQLFGNCETQLVSVPIRNLHTPTESCNLEDIENTIKLIVDIIESGKL